MALLDEDGAGAKSRSLLAEPVRWRASTAFEVTMCAFPSVQCRYNRVFQPQGKHMTNAVRAIASVLFCAAALAACADRPPPAEASPTASELAQWKKDVLDRYKQVAFLNAGSLPISEGQFMDAVRGGRSAFTMNVTSESPDRMTVRLLRPDEAAQVVPKPAP